MTTKVAGSRCSFSFRYLTMAIVLGSVFCATRQAPAQTASWATPTSGSFTTASNWNPAVVPGAGGSAIFNLGSTGYTVSLPSGSGTVSIGPLDLRNDTVSFDLDHAILSVSTAALAGTSGTVANFTLAEGGMIAGTFYVGISGTGTALVENGATVAVTGDSQVASNPGTHGNLTLTDSGSEWSSKSFVVGNAGSGMMLVENGATVSVTSDSQVGSNNTGSGQLTLTGAGTKWQSGSFAMANGGKGTMLVENGATVSVTKTTQVGESNNPGPHQLTITGVGTQWSSGAFVVGNGGSGTTLVEGGAIVSVTGDTQLGGVSTSSKGSGQLTVTDAGTQWSTANVIIGNGGSGTMLVENAAKVLATGVTQLGSNGVSSGQLTVTGADTQWSSKTFIVGTSSIGMMLVEKGATVSVGDDTQLGSSVGSSGNLTLTDAGTNWSAASFEVGNRGSGTMLVENGAAVTVTGATQIASNSGGSGQLTLTGAATRWTSGSTAVNTSGLLTVSTGAIMSAGNLQIVGGTVDTSGGGLVAVGTVSNPTSSMLGTVEVGADGKLYGAGSIKGSLVNGGGQIQIPPAIGTLKPTFAPLTVSQDFTQLPGGSLSMVVISSVMHPGELNVSGNVALGGALKVLFVVDPSVPLFVGEEYELVTGGGSFSTDGLAVDVTGVPAGIGYETQLAGAVYSLKITSVPEPGGFALGVSAIVGLVVLARGGRRRDPTICRPIAREYAAPDCYC